MNKLNILKKNVLFLAGALLLAGCAKVAETPIEVPAEVPVGKTYTIIADLDNPATRSLTHYDETSNKFKFTWEENERIGVVPGGYSSVLEFKAVDPANGRFSFQQKADDSNVYESFVMAVSPRAALGSVSTVDNTVSYTVNYIGAYFQGQSNAIMVAGAATPGSDGTQRFQFKHVGALVKVSYANVPAGTSAMVFSTPDHDITGSFTFNSATGVEAVASAATTNNEARVSFMNPPTEVQASVDFYLPIPTGQYKTFNVKLVDANDATIAGSEQTFSTASPFTVARADVVRCPVVTVTPPPADQYYVKVTSNDDLTSGQYLIVHESTNVAFNGGLTDLDVNSNKISVTITTDGILSDAVTDAASFTILISGENNSHSTIKSASGYFIGRDANSNGLNTNQTTAYYSTISISQDGDAEIVGPGGAHLRYNSAANNWRFRYFKSDTYTNQQPIALYKLSGAAPVTEKVLNSELYISGNIKKQFNVNEGYSFGDGIVKAMYSNGESKTLSVTDVTVSGFNSSVATDSQQITLTYTENGHSATGSYMVSIVGSITGAKYKRVTTLTSGNKYLIVAGNGDGYIMPHPVSSEVQVGVAVTINNEEIPSTESTDACAFTITRQKANSNWYYVISYTTSGTIHYVAASSATNTKLTNITTVPSNVNQHALWNITTPSTSFGTFNIQDAGQTDRSILWRPLNGTTPFNKFGHYQGSGDATYYNVELYEYTTGTTD